MLCNLQMLTVSQNYVWQSQVEIEHHSNAYFDHVTAFKVLLHQTSVQGEAHMLYLDCTYDPHP